MSCSELGDDRGSRAGAVNAFDRYDDPSAFVLDAATSCRARQVGVAPRSTGITREGAILLVPGDLVKLSRHVAGRTPPESAARRLRSTAYVMVRILQVVERRATRVLQRETDVEAWGLS